VHRPSAVRRALLALLLACGLLSALPSPEVAAFGRAAYPAQSQGNRGSDVRAIQYLLRARGYDLTVSGFYGPGTRSVVRAFQSSLGLPMTGVVGSDTWPRLVRRLRTGDSGDAVRALQLELNEKHAAGLSLSGDFGPGTRAAVLRFQDHAGIQQTGEADAATWRNLVWHYEYPAFGRSELCDYEVGNGSAHWGTGASIGQLESAAALFHGRGYGPMSIGDVSLQHGGDIALHATHEQGMDADVRPIKRDGGQCATYGGTNWRSSTYSRPATRALIQDIRARSWGHLKLIYFNDPVLIDEGLTTRYTGHDDHLHVRFCEAEHALAMYRC
jgi:peptidoglycan hydrolase-like protein with peptidoglycan-binding domain